MLNQQGGLTMFDETKCLHSGYTPENGGPGVMPIYQSTTFRFNSTDEIAAVFDDPTKAHIYSRFTNPTVDCVEKKIADLEGGIAAMCTTSGQAASLLSCLNLANSGDRILSTSAIYGGTVNLFAVTMKKFGITVDFIDVDSTNDEIQAAIKPNTKAIFGETLTNPSLQVFDIERFANVAHKNGIPLIVDNTFATPILCKPIEFGADIGRPSLHLHRLPRGSRPRRCGRRAHHERLGIPCSHRTVRNGTRHRRWHGSWRCLLHR